jgi:cellobiose phosphorylase
LAISTVVQTIGDDDPDFAIRRVVTCVKPLLGLRLEGNKLHLAPCIPSDWPSYTVRYRYRETLHHIVVSQVGADEGEASGWMSVTMDGAPQEGRFIPLADDQREHRVEVRFRYRVEPSAPPPD